MSISENLERKVWNRMLLLLLAFAVNYVVYYAYKNIFSFAFYYMGFFYYEKEPFEVITAFVYTLIPALFISPNLRKPSDILIYFLYFFSYGPAILIGLVCVKGSLVSSITYFNILLFCILAIIFLSRINLKFTAVRQFGLNYRTFIILLVVLDVLTLSYLLIQFSFGNFSDLVRLEVYETRSQAKLQINDPISPYLFGLVAYSVGPFMIITGLLDRRSWLIILGVFSNLIIFGLLGSKAAVFIIPFVILLFYMTKIKYRGGIYLSLSIFVVLVISILIDSIFSTQISSYLNRRIFAVPGLLTRIYYEIFSEEPTYNWTYSFLRFFEKSIYDLTPPHLVGKYYFGDVEMSANANIWADGFSNNIPFGPVLITFFVIGLFWFVDSISLKNPRLSILIFSSVAYPFTNSSFFTTLLTHGFLWSLMLFILSPSDSEKTTRT